MPCELPGYAFPVASVVIGILLAVIAHCIDYRPRKKRNKDK